MKKIVYKVTITMPKCDSLGDGEKDLQELIQSDFDMEDEGRWKVEVKKLEEEKMSDYGFYYKQKPIGWLEHKPTNTRLEIFQPIGWFKKLMLKWCFGFEYMEEEK